MLCKIVINIFNIKAIVAAYPDIEADYILLEDIVDKVMATHSS